MSTIWLIVNFLFYTLIINVLYRQSYNLLFFVVRCPITWVGVAGLLGISNMVLAYVMGWDPRLVSAAVITAIILNLGSSLLPDQNKEEMRAMVDDIYGDLELPHGRVQAKIGLATFALSSIGSYILLFIEICSLGGECTPLFKTFF
ncbi:hypothetical protein [Halomonas sp.]|uniref:hypothetical protein n=1 Tax=Halomonas sp. TaxID=1486246 RepID=UPI003D09D482